MEQIHIDSRTLPLFMDLAKTPYTLQARSALSSILTPSSFIVSCAGCTIQDQVCHDIVRFGMPVSNKSSKSNVAQFTAVIERFT